MSDDLIHFRVEIHGLGEPYYIRCMVDPVAARYDFDRDPERVSSRVADELMQQFGTVLRQRIEEAVYG
jgi:hypothetical protein